MTPEEIRDLIIKAAHPTLRSMVPFPYITGKEIADSVLIALGEANLSIVGGGVLMPRPKPFTEAGIQHDGEIG